MTSRAARSAVLAGFAAVLGVIAFRCPEPGVRVDTYWTAAGFAPGAGWQPVPVAVDFIPNHTAGLALRSGLPVYENLRAHGGDFVDPIPDHHGIVSRFGYPPPVAYMFWPLGWLSRSTAWKIWLAFGVAGMTLALALLARLAGGDLWSHVVLACAVLVFYPLIFVFRNGNIALACAVLLAIAIYFLVSGRSETSAALFFALATTLKLYPAVFLLYFAAQRRWGLLWKTLGFVAMLVVLTFSWDTYATFVDRIRRYDLFPQAWYPNASLFSMLSVAGVEFRRAYLAGKAFGLVAVVATIWLLRRRSQDKLPALYECSLVSLAMILAPNTNYDYNLIFAMPVMAALLSDVNQAVRGRKALVVAAGALLALAVPSYFVFACFVREGVPLIPASLLADKFPWLLLLSAATAWRYRELRLQGASFQKAAGPDWRSHASPS